MDKENITNKVKRLIAQNRTEEAIKYLADYQFNNLDKELIILNNKYNRINEEQRLGILSREEANRELTQINLAIIDLTGLINLRAEQEKPKQEAPQQVQKVQEPKEKANEVKAFAEPGFMQKYWKFLPLLLLPFVIWGVVKIMAPSPPPPLTLEIPNPLVTDAITANIGGGTSPYELILEKDGRRKDAKRVDGTGQHVMDIKQDLRNEAGHYSLILKDAAGLQDQKNIEIAKIAPEPKIEVRLAEKFIFQWNDGGSGGKLNGSFYRPSPPIGYYSVGDYAQNNYDPPNGSILLIKPLEDGVLAHPVDFELIWKDSGSGAKRDGSFWRPIPPDGYQALGIVCVGGYNKPPVDVIRCVRKDLLVPGKVGAMIWNDRGTGAHSNFSAWAITGTSPKAISCGTFIGVATHNQPDNNSPLLFCLNPELTKVVEK